ncbi:MAG: tetratricopeptide repeat protein [Elusimicrobiota bacterium]|nr:MAG: tetratricopeptide repeat protein [Elusimicrobiota bacterium]
MTESIINELAQLPSLRVCPRDTVFRYRNDNHDTSRVAHDLNVRAIVTGRLMRRGDDLSVSVELLDAKDKKQLWGKRYDRKISDALAMQHEISRKIFEVLRAKVPGASGRRLSKRGTDNPDAYQAYLKGRYYWNRRTVANIGKALAQFQKAVDADPVYALAYIGLADSYAVLPQYAGVTSAETRPKARAAAERALEIDDSLAEAHASMGYIDMMSWRFKEAESDFGRAIALDPNYSTGHQWYGIFLHVIGRRDEALAESRRAQQLDPLSPIITVQVCNLHMLNGRLPEGIDECRKALELDEGFPRAHDLLGWAYLKQGKSAAAISEFSKAAAASGRASQELSYLGYGYGVLKRREEAMAVLKQLERMHAERRSPAMYLAAVYAGLGDKDQAFAWLEKDFQAQNGALIYMTYFPIYDTLRDDPRHRDLARRIGLKL